MDDLKTFKMRELMDKVLVENTVDDKKKMPEIDKKEYDNSKAEYVVSRKDRKTPKDEKLEVEELKFRKDEWRNSKKKQEIIQKIYYDIKKLSTVTICPNLVKIIDKFNKLSEPVYLEHAEKYNTFKIKIIFDEEDKYVKSKFFDTINTREIKFNQVMYDKLDDIAKKNDSYVKWNNTFSIGYVQPIYKPDTTISETRNLMNFSSKLIAEGIEGRNIVTRVDLPKFAFVIHQAYKRNPHGWASEVALTGTFTLHQVVNRTFLSNFSNEINVKLSTLDLRIPPQSGMPIKQDIIKLFADNKELKSCGLINDDVKLFISAKKEQFPNYYIEMP